MNDKRLLGIDFGDARIGLALSDPLGIFAQPLVTIENTGKRCLKDLAAIVREHTVGIVVTGFPLELDGSVGPQAKKVRKFHGRLERELKTADLGVEMILWDERLTTAQAERVITGSGLLNRERSSALDRISAALILESYMNSRQN